MRFWKREPVLERDNAEWLIACYGWLLGAFGGLAEFRKTSLVLPIDDHFPTRGLRGEALARDLFDRVRAHAGMSDWRCNLVAQPERPRDELARGLLVRREEHPPLGTFSWKNDTAVVSYAPHLIQRPSELIAAFAHELAHYLIATFSQEPPGGVAQLEPATDVAAGFLGFGVFLANASFQFEQYQTGDGWAGWESRGAGYLTEKEHAFGLAIFLELHGLDSSAATRHLDTNPRAYLKRARIDLEQHRPALDALRAIGGAGAHSGGSARPGSLRSGAGGATWSSSRS